MIGNVHYTCGCKVGTGGQHEFNCPLGIKTVTIPADEVIPTGWKCLQCGTVYNPTIEYCYKCSKSVTFVENQN